MTTAKNDVFIFFDWVELTFGGREYKFGGERMNEQIFSLLGDSPIPPVGKILYKLCQQVFIYNEKAPCTPHTSCAKVAILLLQDLSTLCVTDIYGIYCVFSVCNTLGARSLVVSNLRSETKGSRFESGCQLCAEVSSLQ